MQAVIPRASTSPDRAGAETVTTRLSAEFSALSRATVERCVWDTWMCAEHLGLPVTRRLVERIAREHLHGVVKSVPPSSRP